MFILIYLLLSQTNTLETRPVPQSSTLNSGNEECFFAQERVSALEKEQRPIFSRVSTACSKDSSSMSNFIPPNPELQSDTDFLPNGQFGTEHNLDLILTRGAAEFNIDWNDPDMVAEYSKKKICGNHVAELLTTWHSYVRYKHISVMTKEKTRVPICSVPQALKPHSKNRIITSSQYVVQKEEAAAFLAQEGVHLHPGLPVCRDHKLKLGKYAAQKVVEDASYNICPSPPNGRLPDSVEQPELDTSTKKPAKEDDDEECEADTDYVPSRGSYPQRTRSVCPKRKALKQFLESIGVQKIIPKKDFSKLTSFSQNRKAHLLGVALDEMCSLAAPDSPQALKTLVIAPDLRASIDGERTEAHKKLFKVVEDIFLTSNNKRERLYVLSMITPEYTLEEVQRKIKGVSKSMYQRSKRYGLHGRSFSEQQRAKRQRYDASSINLFLEFVASYDVSVGLPFGVRHSKSSDGNVVEIPSMLRIQSNTEIIETFRRKLEESNIDNFKLSDSSMYRILKTCSAVTRKSLHGLDYFIAEAAEAFDEGIEMLEDLQKKELIAGETKQSLHTRLLEMKLYFRTDYKIHIKKKSRSPDHCINHALSDPSEPLYDNDCRSDLVPHRHDVTCDRCFMSDNTLDELEETVATLLSEAKDEEREKNTAHAISLRETLERYQRLTISIRTRIQDLKSHQVRVAASEMDRSKIVEHLQEGEALLTLDWAQRLLPEHSREKSSDYYAKKGISYHVTHCLTRKDGGYAQHSFVHIIYEDTQDSNAVTAILNDTLKLLHGRGITAVTLRSDNAGCYKSASTISSIPAIARSQEVRIKAYSFSEDQAGKGPCDRMAAQIKRKVHDFVDSNHNARNPEEFFAAILHGKHLSGVSVHLGHIISQKSENKKPSVLAGITDIHSFTFETNGLRLRKFASVGQGKLVSYEEFEENKSEFRQTNSHVEEPFMSTIEPQKSTEQTRTTTPSPTSGSTEDKLFHCPEETCSGEFTSHNGLLRHLLIGKHKPDPERLTLRDYALHMYEPTIESIRHTEFPMVEDALTSLVQEEGQPLSPQKHRDSSAKGWALRRKRKGTRLPQKSKEFVIKAFEESEKTNVRGDPRKLAKAMIDAVDQDGHPKYSVDELLSYQQIASQLAALSRAKAKQEAISSKATTSKEEESSQLDDVTSQALLDTQYEQTGDMELEYLKDVMFEDVYDTARKEVKDDCFFVKDDDSECLKKVAADDDFDIV